MLTLAVSLRPDVMPAMVDKCFGAMRQGTKTRASEAALLFIEIENTGEGVVVRGIRPERDDRLAAG